MRYYVSHKKKSEIFSEESFFFQGFSVDLRQKIKIKIILNKKKLRYKSSLKDYS